MVTVVPLSLFHLIQLIIPSIDSFPAYGCSVVASYICDKPILGSSCLFFLELLVFQPSPSI